MSTKTQNFYKNIKSLINLNPKLADKFVLKLKLKSNKELNKIIDLKRFTLEQSLIIASVTGFELDKLINQDVKKWINLSLRKKEIKLLILDIDGTLTDGGMYYSEKGDEMKKFNTKDGLMIRRLTKSGFLVGIISNGTNEVIITRRAQKLGITHLYYGEEKKKIILDEWLKNLGLAYSQVAYVGDDVNDLEIMKLVGLTACPADALNEIKKVSHVILQKNGGDGCVREFIDNYLN